MRVAFYTLGCKVNQYETQALEQLLTRRGHTLVPFEGEADAYVINTCTVTAVSDKKSRQVIRRARKTAPDAVVAVCGCYPQTHPEDMDGLSVDLVSGTGDRLGFVELLERTWKERQPHTALDNAMARRVFEELPAGGLEGRTRAMLKVEDGCVNFCTYCIIPYARGPIRSLPLERAAAQAAQLMEEGYRELVLTGIELSSWGHEWRDGPALIDLIEGVCRAAPPCRIRLGSLEPELLTDADIARLAAVPELCGQFHLSLQSGCDATLARMNRHYTTARYREIAAALRGAFPGCAITTDVITGFPGETEEEFSATCRFVEEMGFAMVHIFPYSERRGTAAASLPDPVPVEERRRRAARLAAVTGALAGRFYREQVGTVQPVLIEKKRLPDRIFGYTPNYAPVTIFCPEDRRGEILTVRITAADGAGCTGEPV